MPDLLSAKAYLDSVDLTYLIDVMCGDDYCLPRWTRAEAALGVKHYKQFLWLHKKYPDQSLVPTRQVDELWHNHILFTRCYARDCLNIFGHYLHHEPTPLGADPDILVNDYLATKALYQQEFGEKGLTKTLNQDDDDGLQEVPALKQKGFGGIKESQSLLDALLTIKN